MLLCQCVVSCTVDVQLQDVQIFALDTLSQGLSSLELSFHLLQLSTGMEFVRPGTLTMFLARDSKPGADPFLLEIENNCRVKAECGHAIMQSHGVLAKWLTHPKYWGEMDHG